MKSCYEEAVQAQAHPQTRNVKIGYYKPYDDEPHGIIYEWKFYERSI